MLACARFLLALVALGVAACSTGGTARKPAGDSSRYLVTDLNNTFTVGQCRFTVPWQTGWFASAHADPKVELVTLEGANAFQITALTLPAGTWKPGVPPERVATMFFDGLQRRVAADGATQLERGEEQVAGRTIYTLRWRQGLPNGPAKAATTYLSIHQEPGVACIFRYDETRVPGNPATTRVGDVTAILSTLTVSAPATAH